MRSDALADGLARLTDAELEELDAFALEAIFADETVADLLGRAGIGYASMPDEIVAAVRAHFDPVLDALRVEQDRRIDLRFHCLDCDVHTGEIGQYPYGCPDELWQAVVTGGHGMLCLGCLAKRLDSAGLPWPWSKPAEQMAAELAQACRGGCAERATRTRGRETHEHGLV